MEVCGGGVGAAVGIAQGTKQQAERCVRQEAQLCDQIIDIQKAGKGDAVGTVLIRILQPFPNSADIIGLPPGILFRISEPGAHPLRRRSVQLGHIQLFHLTVQVVSLFHAALSHQTFLLPDLPFVKRILSGRNTRQPHDLIVPRFPGIFSWQENRVLSANMLVYGKILPCAAIRDRHTSLRTGSR